jgi:MFS family permease
MITWGFISGAMMFVTTPTMFYVLRFLLGVAEAGFFPGIILYLTYWYPAQRRGRITALFMTAIPLSGVVGGPLSGWVLQSFAGLNGWAGWQWMFLIEAVPSIIVGAITLLYLDDGIRRAKWLSDAEKALLESRVANEARGKDEHSLRDVFAGPKMWLMSAIYFCFVMGLYGVSFWLPTIIKATGVKGALEIGFLTAIPYAAASVCMILVSRRADRLRERRWHLAIPAVVGGVGLILSAVYGDNTVLALAALTLATAGIVTTLPLFWSLPTALLGGTAAAAGIAMINSLGNLAGFASPYLVGLIKDLTHSTNVGMYLLAASMFVGAALTLSVSAKLVNNK